MTLIRRMPYRLHVGLEQQLLDMHRLMNSLAARSAGSSANGDDGDGSTQRGFGFNPAADVYREEGNLVVELELPGVDIDNDVDIEIRNGDLIIEGHSSSERTDESGGVYLSERRTGRFCRTMSLPDGVDADDVHAEYDDGLLRVSLPIPDEVEDGGSRRIEVQRGSDGSSRKAIEGSTTSESRSDDSDAAADSKRRAKKSAEKKKSTAK